ncbi:hypothetical protein SDC9_212933 [bioreactor metagenome]|uniref:Uncharacterized protein n=1 Tax=bioreactor metagenome TaxID=1076179 RepID=A0A645K0S5_9ZZZZ
MLGSNYEQSIYNTINTRRNGLIFEDANNINIANGSGITISSNYEKWRIAEVFSGLTTGLRIDTYWK